MRKIRCYDCGKRYDYDIDDFCPKCGSFTQPARVSRIGADGSVVWNDGINERGHQNSFVHSEYHEENRKRGGSRLESKSKRSKVKLPLNISTEMGIAKWGNKKKTNQIGQGTIAIIVFIIYCIYLFMR